MKGSSLRNAFARDKCETMVFCPSCQKTLLAIKLKVRKGRKPSSKSTAIVVCVRRLTASIDIYLATNVPIFVDVGPYSIHGAITVCVSIITSFPSSSPHLYRQVLLIHSSLLSAWTGFPQSGKQAGQGSHKVETWGNLENYSTFSSLRKVRTFSDHWWKNHKSAKIEKYQGNFPE